MTTREELEAMTTRELVDRCRRAGASGAWLVAANVKPSLIAYLMGEGAPTAPPPPTPTQAVTPADPRAALDALRSALGVGAVDESQVRAIVADALAGFEGSSEAAAVKALDSLLAVLPDHLRTMAADLGLGRTIVVPPDGARIDLGSDVHVHPAIDDVILALKARAAAPPRGLPQNVMLVGPAGTGKSTLAEHACKVLGKADPLVIPCGDGTPERTFVGRLGLTEYEQAAFVDAYEGGRPIILDEIDALSPAVAIVLNAATANGGLPLPDRRSAPWAKRHPDAIILGTANTYGTGPTAIYCGRNQLDGATLDRWSIVPVGYDTGLERQMAAACPNVLAAIHDARTKMDAAKMRRVLSTRLIQEAAGFVAVGKADAPSTVAWILTNRGWTREELSRVGL